MASSPQASAATPDPEDEPISHRISPPASPTPAQANRRPGLRPRGQRPTDDEIENRKRADRASRDASTDELWAACRKNLCDTVSEVLWLGYFRHLQALSIDSVLAVLIAPNTMIRDRVQRRYLPMLHTAFESLSVQPHTIEVEIRPDLDLDDTDDVDAEFLDREILEPQTDVPQHLNADAQSPDTRSPNAVTPNAVYADPWHPAQGKQDSPGTGPADASAVLGGDPANGTALTQGATNARYTFDNFVQGDNNRFALAAALAVAETPGLEYNPLFIHGSTGLGKTHLLQAIVNFISKNSPDKRVAYVSTETFLSEFIEAIRTSSTPAFKRRYRGLDVLLLDDIQFMEGKEGLQEELFHTFNSLHVSGRQIVISSDRQPRNIATLSDRLRSRFEWGLITDIQPPNLETRLAILRKKNENVKAPDEVLEHIARLVTNNIRELEGALVRVTAYASLTRHAITLEMAEQVLHDISEPQQKLITTDLILQTTSDMFGFTIVDLIGQGRRQDLVLARQISMYVMRELTDLSFPAIATVFGGRDHTTVMHSVKKISKLLPTERKVYDNVAQLRARLLAA